jgi:hypothetical protein
MPSAQLGLHGVGSDAEKDDRGLVIVRQLLGET